MVVVAIEQYFPEEVRLIDDDLALQILPGRYRFFVQLMRIPWLRNWMFRATEKSLAGIWAAMMVRKRYIDEKVATAVADKTVAAIVNLGAGYDTRTYRLPALARVPVWEVDQPVNLAAKQKGVEKALGSVPTNITFVPINFMAENLEEVLKAHGYTRESKTFFIWEAVSQYLTETAVRRTFEFLAQVPAGSQLAFTYVRKDFIEGTNLFGAEKFHDQMVVKDKVWHFGFAPEEVADFLQEYGWRLLEDVGYDELAKRYIKPGGRGLVSTPIERMVFAAKA